MKREAAVNGKGRGPPVKIVKKEQPPFENGLPHPFYTHPDLKPSVEIEKCLSFQKFRYNSEKRPGKKYQEKEFMTVRLNNLQDKVVQIIIMCTDADNCELIHPNGLVGKDCHDGIYDKEIAVTKSLQLFRIPYLRIVRFKKNEDGGINAVLKNRAEHIPTPYKERCMSQLTSHFSSSFKFDTTKVCLGLIAIVRSHVVPFNGSLHAISHVVRNAGEKTALGILKLSNIYVSSSGGQVEIFTTEEGPAIEPEKYEVYVTYDVETSSRDSCKLYTSEKFYPSAEDILYKKVITYKVPPFYPNPSIPNPVPATLHLDCPQSNQFCEFSFTYIPEGHAVLLDQPASDQPKQ